MSVGFRPLLESSSLVSNFQAIPQGPCPHTRAAKDHPTCQPWPNSFLPNKRVYANIGISGMCESLPSPHPEHQVTLVKSGILLAQSPGVAEGNPQPRLEIRCPGC